MYGGSTITSKRTNTSTTGLKTKRGRTRTVRVFKSEADNARFEELDATNKKHDGKENNERTRLVPHAYFQIKDHESKYGIGPDWVKFEAQEDTSLMYLAVDFTPDFDWLSTNEARCLKQIEHCRQVPHHNLPQEGL